MATTTCPKCQGKRFVNFPGGENPRVYQTQVPCGTCDGRGTVRAPRPPNYTPEIDRALEAFSAGTGPEDFAALAMAALDQAGLSLAAQRRVLALLDEAQFGPDAPWLRRAEVSRG